MVRGVRNALYTVDLGAMIRTIDMCREHKWGAENTCAGEKLRIKSFMGFSKVFQVDTTKGLGKRSF
jgi:hypothetical protein